MLLIIEDNSELPAGETERLRAAGYTILHAEDGTGAVRAAAGVKEPPDLIIIGPGLRQRLSGAETAEIVEAGGNVSVLFLSPKEGFTSLSSSRVLATEKEIRQSEERFSKMFHANPGPSMFCDMDSGEFLDVNDEFCRIVGFSRDELIGRSSQDLGIWPEEYSRKSYIESLRKTGSLREIDIRIRTKSGEQRDVKWSAEIVTLNDKKVTLSLLRDITESKRAETALRENERKYRALINSLNDTVWVGDFFGNILDMNDTAIKVLGYSREELRKIGVFGIDPFMTGEELKRLYIENPPGSTLVFETTHRTKGGRLIPVEISVSPISYNNENELLSIARDITARKQAEEEIRSLLREKEVILKEVHHRVRNNMNTLYSLLHLQARAQEDDKVTDILTQTAGRIRTMLAIYNKLYCSENRSAVSVGEYFSSLMEEIISVFPRSEEISIECQAEEMALQERILSPLGIIVNELITNSMKYAFQERKSGKITLDISRKEDILTVRYRDDGTGIPESVTLGDSPGFGLNLVEMLAAQLGATLSIGRTGGTEFTIVMKT